MKKTLFVAALFFIFSAFAEEVQAQNYDSAIGLRLGYPSSVSYKMFLNDSHAVEGYVSYRRNSGWSWIGISAAYQVHSPIDAVDGLQWYWGGGAGAYIWTFNDTSGFYDNYGTTSFGIQGYLGLDYTFANVPINVSIDWVPTYFLNGYGDGFGADNGAIAVRYILSE